MSNSQVGFDKHKRAEGLIDLVSLETDGPRKCLSSLTEVGECNPNRKGNAVI